MTYTLADYVRDHGRPLMRYWRRHVYDGKPVRLPDGRIIKRGETI